MSTLSMEFYIRSEDIWQLLKDESPDINMFVWQIPMLPEIASALLIAGYILVFIFAFCGNFAAIIVCIRSKFTRPATRWFLIFLAVTDLIYCSFNVIVSLTQIVDKFHSWILGSFMCKITDFMQTVGTLTNCGCLIAIAVQRYFAVVRGLKVPRLSQSASNLVANVSLVFVWVVPIAFAAPILTYYSKEPFWVWESDINGTAWSDNITHYLCIQTHYEDNRVFSLVHHIVIGALYASLTATFLFSYCSIMAYVRKNFSHFPGERQQPAGHSRNNSLSDTASTRIVLANHTSNNHPPGKRHRRTAKLLASLIIIFVVCRSPIYIWGVVLYAIPTFPTTPRNMVIRYALQLLACVKSAVNPFIYIIWNDALRSSSTGSNCRTTATSTKSCSCFGCSLWALKNCCKQSCGREPRSYDFQEGGHTSRVAPVPTESLRVVFTTSDKIETANRTLSMWQSIPGNSSSNTK